MDIDTFIEFLSIRPLRGCRSIKERVEPPELTSDGWGGRPSTRRSYLLSAGRVGIEERGEDRVGESLPWVHGDGGFQHHGRERVATITKY